MHIEEEKPGIQKQQSSDSNNGKSNSRLRKVPVKKASLQGNGRRLAPQVLQLVT
jgi:hypothetical protein